MIYLTKRQIRAAMEKHDYILLRMASGYLFGVNCKILNFYKSVNYNPEDNTPYISCRPCDLNEYITYKHPFL